MSNKRWYERCANDGDVVISTRIRLARNLCHTPFPASLTPEQKAEVAATVWEAVSASEGDTMRRVEMTDLSETEVLSMVERHVISPEFARRNAGDVLLIARDEGVSIMVNEEDHLRLQVLSAGLDLDAAFETANRLDDALDARLKFAFDERLGYLTQCPSNLGTGMRASLMLHLPALQEKGIVQQLAATVSKLGLTIRGMYGEGSKSAGAIYQLSNQVTLGITEREAIENLKSIAGQIIKEERTYREQLVQTPAVQDRIFRSLGILQNARLLTGKEFMTMISNVRMGVAAGLVDAIDLEGIGTLLTEAQPATLMLKNGRELDPEERDALRAALLRERLQR